MRGLSGAQQRFALCQAAALPVCGVKEMMEKECFGEQCKTCSEFWSCSEHWGNGDQWE